MCIRDRYCVKRLVLFNHQQPFNPFFNAIKIFRLLECDCHLPGTDGGNNNLCNTFTGRCVCNKTLNVGGRQCNTCKENSYNVSLTENLRCQGKFYFAFAGLLFLYFKYFSFFLKLNY